MYYTTERTTPSVGTT